MRRVLFTLSLALFLAAVVSILRQSGRAQSGGTNLLKGSVATIDAARYPSIQAALDALPESGGMVQLPAGTFEIRAPLVIRRGDVSLVGAGSATHIRNVNKTGQAALVIAHPQHDRSGNDRKHELWRVRLADFRITGNPGSGPGIAAYNINEIFIDGVTVSDHGGDGVLLSYCYEDPRVCDSLFTYNKAIGLNLQGCHDIVVAANQFEENQDAVHCFNGFNLCMNGNCLDDHLGDGVVIENTYGSVLSGNMIEECNGTAIVLDRNCYGNTISANVIAHNGAGVDLRDAHGCAVSANTFTIMKSRALRIGPASGRIAVSGNVFSSSYIGDGLDRRKPGDRAAAGMVLDGARDSHISSNLFSGVGPLAIDQKGQGDRPLMVSDNLFVETQPGVPTLELKSPRHKLNHLAK